MHCFNEMAAECFFLFLFGYPGCEQKSQVADELVNRCGIPYVAHVSVGRWLKAQAAAPQTELGAYCNYNWNDDALDAIASEYVELVCADFATQCGASGATQSNTQTPKALIITGYPRTPQQAAQLAHICRGRHVFAVEFAHAEAATDAARKPHRELAQTTDRRLLQFYNKRQPAIHAALSPSCLWCVFNSGRTTQEIADKLIADTATWLTEPARHMVRLVISPAPPARINAVFTVAGAIESAQIVQTTLRLADATRTQRHFCGSQPISLLREHLPRLRRFAYVVSLKADGERFLCLVHASSLWFVSRNLSVFRSVYRPALAPHNGTLLDGEYVHASGLFIVLDCLAVQGRNITMQPLVERLDASVGVGALFADGSAKPWFRPQEYVGADSAKLAELLAKRVDRPFALDGMVFTPARLPYRLGIDFNMFKWKSPDENTADLLYLRGVLFCRQTRRGLGALPGGAAHGTTSIAEDEVDYVDSGGVRSHLSPIGKLVVDTSDMRKFEGCILECQLVHGDSADTYVWRCKRVRPDKRGANLDWICAAIVHSIREHITLADLSAAVVAR